MPGLKSYLNILRNQAYVQVDSQSLLSATEQDDSSFQEKSTHKSTPYRLVIYLCSILCLFIISSATLGILALTRSLPDQACAVQLSIYSPALEAVEYKEMEIPNPFAHKTIYRGPPTPKLERAWESLWAHGGVRIPRDKLPALNRTTDLGEDRFLRPVNDTEGGYHSLLEVFHQLHCLAKNLIRQYTWRDYYKRHPEIVRMPDDMRDTDVGARMHVDHCIETLRIVLMCHSDVTPQMVMDDPKSPIGFRPDFSPLRKCRNFDRIKEWATENMLGAELKMDFEPEKANAHHR